MKEQKPNLNSRRKFIAGLSAIAVGGPILGSELFSINTRQDKPKKLIWDKYSPEEQKIVDKSKMVANISKYRNADHSCASTIMASAVEYMGLDKSYTDVAASYGGGIGKRDLCGFLTGAVMALGLHSGMVKESRKEIQAHSRKLSNLFWDWWKTLSPLHCADMYAKYDKDGFDRMMKRVACKVEELISSDYKSKY